MVTILFHLRESFKVEEQHDSFKKIKGNSFLIKISFLFVVLLLFIYVCYFGLLLYKH
jgi:capsule polysaccharide export protein KpsE/RkpR